MAVVTVVVELGLLTATTLGAAVPGLPPVVVAAGMGVGCVGRPGWFSSPHPLRSVAVVFSNVVSRTWISFSSSSYPRSDPVPPPLRCKTERVRT